MSDNNMQDLFNNVQKMVDSGNIPDDLKNMVSNISPEMLNNFKDAFNSSNNNSFNNSNSSNNFSNSESSTGMPNIDMNTILKMKSVMEKMNDKNDPRSNLLYSLKPYLRETKQEKLDQYVNLLNVSKIAEVLKNDKKDDKNA